VGRIRIIAGEFKGRRIDVPDQAALRPTGDRVREALFSRLGPYLEGVRLLDAFSGTGALGFEALSRGAGEVVFMESDPATVAAIRRTADQLGVRSRCLILLGDAIRLLAAEAERGGFSVVLADPPYRSERIDEFLAEVVRSGLLTADGILVLERDARSKPGHEGVPELEWVDSRRYGSSSLDWFRARPDEKAP